MSVKQDGSALPSRPGSSRGSERVSSFLLDTVLATAVAVTWMSLTSYVYGLGCDTTDACWPFIGMMLGFTIMLTLAFPLLTLLTVGLLHRLPKFDGSAARHTSSFLTASSNLITHTSQQSNG